MVQQIFRDQVRRSVVVSVLAAIFFTMALPRPAAAQIEPTSKQYQRWKYFHHQRAYPLERIPPGALQAAREDYRKKWSGGALAPSINVGPWSSIGPAPIGTSPTTSGRTNSIAVHPTNPSIIFIGAADGGVWKTTNGGSSWTPLTDSQCSLAMGGLAIDPVNPNIVYAGTGEENFSADSYYGCGVLRSTDGGATWTQFGASAFESAGYPGHTISRVLIDRVTAGTTNNTHVLVTASSGVYGSLDSGNTWTQLLAGTATDAVSDPTNSSILYAALGNIFGDPNNGVYKSTNGGTSWTKLAGGFPTANVGRINIAIAPTLPSTLYASVQSTLTFQLLGIFKSTDSGNTWTHVAASGTSCGGQCWYDMYVYVDPTNANIVYFGGLGIYKSTDGGATFTEIAFASGVHTDQHALAFQPGSASTLFAGNDGGVFKSADSGATWTSLNGNLAITQYYPGLSLHPTNASIALGGTQDNDVLLYGGSPSWTSVGLGCDGGFTAIDYVTPTTMYAECQGQSSFSGPRRSDNGGAFVQTVNGINLNDAMLFIPPIAMSPTNSQTLYFGTYRLYKTTNRGDLWTAISPQLSASQGPFDAISTIAEAKSNSQVVYVGTSDGNVQLTTSGGGSWALITSGLPNRSVTYVAIDPTNANNAFVTMSGFNSGHVFKTTNAGTNWTDISGNLPNIPVNAIVLDPGAPTTNIYVGTDLGVFNTTNGGTTWSPFSNGLPQAAVFDLVFNQATGVLLGATHGRSVWSGLAPTSGAGPIFSAVLPYARSVQIGAQASAFGSVINSGSTTATRCGLALPPGPQGSFIYQTTDASNNLTGSPNTPIDIPTGATQHYVFGYTPTLPLSSLEIGIAFQCSNTAPAASVPGVNTFIVSAATTPTPDIVAIAATTNNDGIVHIPGTNGTGVFAAAGVNIGIAATITASPDDGGRGLPVVLTICQTDPNTGNCLSPPAASTTINYGNNATLTFTVFVQGTGNIPFDPANNRLFLRFKDAGGVTRGATNVAVRTN